MTNRQILIELTAMALYNCDWPDQMDWIKLDPEHRQCYRDRVADSTAPEQLVDPPEVEVVALYGQKKGS